MVAPDRPVRRTQRALAEIAVNHMVISLVGLIDWWLTRAGGLRPDVDEMARIYDRVIIGAPWQALLEARPPARASVE